jgi:hypothetical protein
MVVLGMQQSFFSIRDLLANVLDASQAWCGEMKEKHPDMFPDGVAASIKNLSFKRSEWDVKVQKLLAEAQQADMPDFEKERWNRIEPVMASAFERLRSLAMRISKARRGMYRVPSSVVEEERFWQDEDLDELEIPKLHTAIPVIRAKKFHTADLMEDRQARRGQMVDLAERLGVQIQSFLDRPTREEDLDIAVEVIECSLDRPATVSEALSLVIGCKVSDTVINYNEIAKRYVTAVSKFVLKTRGHLLKENYDHIRTKRTF